jgi:hypothetical protein
MTRTATRGGVVRTARLTDLAAVGELSRRSSRPHEDTRSLGLPVAGLPISVFGLFALPLGAFLPSDRLYVHVRDGTVTGLARLELEPNDEATLVELDAVGADAGEIRFRLVNHVLRDGAKRGVTRFHVACVDAMANVELFMQAGFIRYGEERLLYRGPEDPLPAAMGRTDVAAAHIRPVAALDAMDVARLYAAVTPQPVLRLEAYRLADWERVSDHSQPPRSSLTPLLRFSDLETYVRDASATDGGKRLDGFLHVGIAQATQPHYVRVLALPGSDAVPLIRFALGVIGARTSGRRYDGLFGHRAEQGVLAPVRSYEAPIDRHLEEEGFREIATLTLLMKETLVRIAEPALVPAMR